MIPTPLKLPKLDPRLKSDKPVPKYTPVRHVTRYRAGQVPEFQKPTSPQQYESSAEESLDNEEKLSIDDDEEEDAKPIDLERVFVAESQETDFSGLRRKGIYPIPETTDESELSKRQEEAVENHSSEDGSSYSSSSEDYGETVMLLKPIFKPKEQRIALEAERQREAKQKSLEAEAQIVAEDIRRKEAQNRVSQVVEEQQRAREEALKAVIDVIELPDDEIQDEDAEYEAWKIRELGRLYRDYRARIVHKEEIERIEKRRNMNEEERLADDAKLDNLAPKLKKQGRMLYMQKYYHKGAFYQDVAASGVERTFDKDFNAPVAEDLVDKSLLPAVMRVRRGDWGKKSRSKHTNLRDIDTTDVNSPWVAKQLANSDVDRPSKKRARNSTTLLQLKVRKSSTEMLGKTGVD